MTAQSQDGGRGPTRAHRPRSHVARRTWWHGASRFRILLLFLVFMAGPILVALFTSFTDMRVTDIRNPLDVEFIGIENYVAVLADARFQKAAANTPCLRAGRRAARPSSSGWRRRSA